MNGKSLGWPRLSSVFDRHEKISRARHEGTVIDTKNGFESQAFFQERSDELTVNEMK